MIYIYILFTLHILILPHYPGPSSAFDALHTLRLSARLWTSSAAWWALGKGRFGGSKRLRLWQRRGLPLGVFDAVDGGFGNKLARKARARCLEALIQKLSRSFCFMVSMLDHSSAQCEKKQRNIQELRPNVRRGQDLKATWPKPKNIL